MVYCEGCEICDGLKEHYYHFAYEKVRAVSFVLNYVFNNAITSGPT